MDFIFEAAVTVLLAPPSYITGQSASQPSCLIVQAVVVVAGALNCVRGLARGTDGRQINIKPAQAVCVCRRRVASVDRHKARTRQMSEPHAVAVVNGF